MILSTKRMDINGPMAFQRIACMKNFNIFKVLPPMQQSLSK